jgi:predicted HicB family RNase H-like nuclease
MTTTEQSATEPRRVDAERLARAPYTFTLVEDADSGYWTAGVLEFPGSNAEGASPDEAIADARRGLVDFIDIYLEQGRAVPDPFETRAFSGRTELRLNPETHRRATVLATHEGVSLNRWLSAAVATYAGTGAASTEAASQIREALEALVPAPTTGGLALVSETPGDYTAPGDPVEG